MLPVIGGVNRGQKLSTTEIFPHIKDWDLYLFWKFQTFSPLRKQIGFLVTSPTKAQAFEIVLAVGPRMVVPIPLVIVEKHKAHIGVISSADCSFVSWKVKTFLGVFRSARFLCHLTDCQLFQAHLRGFLMTAVFTATAGFLSAFSSSFPLLIILRCLVGFGLGGGPVLSAWFLEFIPASHRGTWMVVFSGFWTVGTVLEASLAWAVMPRLGWRWLLGFSALPSSLLLLFYGVTLESPRYLCMKGRKIEALLVLERIARMNGTKLPCGILVSDNQIELDEYLSASEDKELLSPSSSRDVIPEQVESSQGGISPLATLFSPELAKSTILLWIVFFGNAFSYYGLVLLTTELSGSQNECTPAELKLKQSHDVSYRDVFITSFAEFPGLILSAATIDKLGRKLSMAIMFFLCSMFLIPLVYHQPLGLTTGLLFGARTCITATFTIVYIYAPEIYPTSVRSTGVGIASSMGRIGGIICPLVAVGLMHGCHRSLAIILFEGVLLLSGVCIFLFPFETKGRELSDTVRRSKRQTAFA